MGRIYTTTDYFKDSFWFIDAAIKFINKIKYFIKTTIIRVIDFDYATYVFRILENIPYGIAIFLLGFFLTINLIRLTESQNGIFVSSITTGSMNPAIVPGSMIIIMPNIIYEKNDIIAYKEKSLKSGFYSGRILTHRIIEKNLRENNSVSFTTKGDNNKNPDSSYVTYEDIIGKVNYIIPYLGYLDFLSRTIPGFMIFIAFPFIFIIIEVRKYVLSN